MLFLNKLQNSVLIWFLSIAWLVSFVRFLLWWGQSSNIGNTVGYILTSFMILWPMILPGYCLFFILKTKKSQKRELPLPKLRVAMIVTKAPSEPFNLVKRTLLAAKAQKYIHDTWVADEDPTEEAYAWYKAQDIKVSTRKGDMEYDNETWPRRRKCKEGNLAYFYDHFGYKKYDVVVQMDADHVASKNYLENMILPFSDENVGYVAAPSICDANADVSWAARARLYSEAMFHGPIQTGANEGWVPVCIGSHYAVRTKALKQIGGIGPELAEDYSTSLTFNAHGWKGVFASDAIAHGDGPNDFTSLMIQDYQWSRSLVTLLLSFYVKYWSMLPLKKKVQFTFTQLWYPISALVWLLTIILPALTLLTGQSPVHVNFNQFIEYALIPQAIMFVVFLVVRAQGLLRPKKVKIYSWENALFELARWPWVLLACIDAVIAFITKEERSFKVTSKNKESSDVLTLRIVSLYFFVILLNLVSLVFKVHTRATDGYFWFVLLTTLMYLFLVLVSVTLHIKESVNFSKQFLLGHGRLYTYSLCLLFALILQTAVTLHVKAPEDSFIEINQRSSVNMQTQFEVIAERGDSNWSLSRNLVNKYMDYKNENLNAYQVNKLTHVLSSNFENKVILVGTRRSLNVFQIENARRLAGI